MIWWHDVVAWLVGSLSWFAKLLSQHLWISLEIIPAIHQRLYNHDTQKLQVSPQTFLLLWCNVFSTFLKQLKNKWMYVYNSSKQISGGHDWITFLSLVKPRQCVLDIFFNDINKKCKRYPANASALLCFHTRTFLTSWCCFPYIIVLCACLIILMLRGELDVASKYIIWHAEYMICLQKMFALFGKGSTGSCKKLHVSFKEKLASAYHSRTYISYINAALRSSANSSAYGWLSYWVFILSTSCPFLFIWSNSKLFPSCLLSKCVWGGHFFNL